MRGLILLFALGTALAQSPAPELTLDRVIPAGEATWTALRGKPVVVEFWATWCGNCVAEIPKFNELAAKFPQIQFLSVTDEPLSTVQPFLAKRPISGWVGIDRDGATFRAFGVSARPRTFLVDREGVLRGSMHPAQLNEATLTDFAAGRPIKPAGLFAPPKILSDPGADPVFAVMLRPSNNPKPGGVMGVDSGRLNGNNLFLRLMLSYAYSVGERWMEGPEPQMSTRWDFCVLLPDGAAGDRQLLRDLLERSFQLKIRRDPRWEEAIVLRLAEPKPQSTGLGQIAILTRLLEARLGKAVVDQTGLQSYPLFELPDSPEELRQALRSKLGIEMVTQTRLVDHLIFDRIVLPTYRTR